MKKFYCALTTLCVSVFLCSNLYALSIVMQPNATEGKDASNYSFSPSWNVNGIYLWARNNYNNGTYNYSFIEFDLSLIPSNAKIDNATMALYIAWTSGSSYIDAYRVTSGWNETTVNWSNQPTIDNSSEIANLGGVPTAGQWVEWNITSFVNGWYTGLYNNYGIELRNDASNTHTDLYSSDYGSESLRPKLTIEYTVIPEPATLLLLGMSWLGFLLKRICK